MKDQLESLIVQLVERGVRFPDAQAEFEKKYIRRVLDHARGNQSRAARILGMHRNTLSRTIGELRIDVRQFRDGGKRPPRSARIGGYEKKMAR